MNMSRPIAVAASVVLCLVTAFASAAAPGVVVDGLHFPTKLLMLPGGNLLVSEQGQVPAAPPDPYPFEPNEGRISMVTRGGSQSPLLEGLPSGLDLDLTAPSGPTGMELSGPTRLYFEIGQGDSILRIAGSERPNPDGPSSALLSSVWRAQFSKPIEQLGGGFTLDPASHYPVLEDGGTLRLDNAYGEHVWLTVLADLRDLYPAQPPNAVTGSNPFGLEQIGPYLYLPDAGQNSLVRVNRVTGRIRTVAHFPPVPNPLPFGPPVSNAVPNSVQVLPGPPSVLVTLFPGFPFNQGAGRIDRVNVLTGTASSYLTGLTLPIDVLPLGRAGGATLVLEYASAFSLTPPAVGFQPPGRLLRFDHPGSAATVVSDELAEPTSMVLDRKTRELFVTEIGAGRIVKLNL